jgi:hypothetical protein
MLLRLKVFEIGKMDYCPDLQASSYANVGGLEGRPAECLSTHSFLDNIYYLEHPFLIPFL